MILINWTLLKRMKMIVVVTVMIMTRERSLNTGSHGKNQLLLLLLLTLMLKLVRLYSTSWHYFSKMGSQDSQMRSILLSWITQIIQSYCKSQGKPHTGYSCIPFSRIAVYIIKYHVFSQGKKLKKTSICTKRTLQT